MKLIPIFLFVIFSARLIGAEVNIAEITEERFKSNSKNNFFSSRDTLSIKFEVKDQKFTSATHYKFEVKKVTDNTGKKLELKKSFGNKGFEKVSRFSVSKSEKAQGVIKPELKLTTSARKAASVDIDAVLVIKLGKIKEVVIENALGMKNKKITHPALKKCGITLTCGAGNEMSFGRQGTQAINFKLEGETDKVISYEMINVKGEKISNGTSSSGFNGVYTYSVSTDKKVDSAHLKLSVSMGETLVRIPVKLKKVLLP
ncbi:MAG: hypothetical protein MK132_17195 [Lentisphaerales bacterium]|nr:hypothetical protein [Lentisphaerales bacterium]